MIIKMLIPSFVLIQILILSPISADSSYETFLFKPGDILNKECFIQKVSSADEVLYPYLGNANNSITNEEIVIILNKKILIDPTFVPNVTNNDNIFNTSDFNLLSDEDKIKCVISNRDFLIGIYPDFLSDLKGDEVKNNVHFNVKFNEISSNDQISYEIQLLLNEILSYKKYSENLNLLELYFLCEKDSEKDINYLANFLDTQNKTQKFPLNIFSSEYDSTLQEVIVYVKLSAAGLWKEPAPRPPPPEPAVEPEVPDLVLDYSFFDQNCI